jgi:predicted phage-related endonuclease
MTPPRIARDLPEAEWHAIRARNIGSSEVAALFDLPADQMPAYMVRRFALWHIKAGDAPAPDVSGERPKWGLRLEAAIADAVSEQEGWTVERGGYVADPTTPGLGCTLDFVIEGDPAEDGPGVLECKNVDWLIYKRSWTGEEPPPHILLQLQHQLAATGFSWGAIAPLIGGNETRVYRYKARPKLIAEIRRRVREFWASIEMGLPPTPDGSSSASEVLASLYPELVDDAVDMGSNNEWAEAAHALFSAAASRKAAKLAYDEAKNRVALLLDGHRRGYGNGWAVNCSITSANPGRLPEPGELIGRRAESRSYTAKETVR